MKHLLIGENKLANIEDVKNIFDTKQSNAGWDLNDVFTGFKSWDNGKPLNAPSSTAAQGFAFSFKLSEANKDVVQFIFDWTGQMFYRIYSAGSGSWKWEDWHKIGGGSN